MKLLKQLKIKSCRKQEEWLRDESHSVERRKLAEIWRKFEAKPSNLGLSVE